MLWVYPSAVRMERLVRIMIDDECSQIQSIKPRKCRRGFVPFRVSVPKPRLEPSRTFVEGSKGSQTFII